MSLPLPPPRRRRRRPVLLAVIAGLAVLAVASFALRPPSGRAPGKPSQAESPHQVHSRVPPQTAGSAPLSVSTTGWLAAPLDGTTVPISASDGPRQVSGPLAAGFTDTTAGAVLAAVNIAVRAGGQIGPAIFTPTITQQVTGSAAAALLATAQQDYAVAIAQHPPADPGGPAGTAGASVVAFRLLAWTAAAATVSVLTVAGGTAGSRPAAGPLGRQ